MADIELVVWRDAFFDKEEITFDGDFLCETVGWIEEFDDVWLRIISEHTPGGNRSVSMIPRAIVVSRTVLKRGGKK